MPRFLNRKPTWFMAAVLSGFLLIGFTHTEGAERGNSRHREFRDSRYRHDRSHPTRGQYIGALPHGHRVVPFGRERFHFFNGIWYRPVGNRFLVVAPPIGLVVPFLPPFHSTLWFGGVPYYYANEVYYTSTPGGYVVAEPPKSEISQPAPLQTESSAGQIPFDRLFVYPRLGQSEQKQADDRFECHNWAVGQTGYDPTNPPADRPETQLIQKRSDYQRSLSACLEGRGYTVR